MIFASKHRGPYTQLYITHIDANGNDTPAVLLENFVLPERAVNIPEFVNIAYDELASISAPTVEYYRHYERGVELAEDGELDKAIAALSGGPGTLA